jgi:tol-pal system protein YbgF
MLYGVGLNFILLISTVQAATQSNLEDRVARLERMANNPVLLKLSERLAEQQQEIGRLNDRIDRLKYAVGILQKQSTKQYLDADSRLTQLEKVPKETSMVAPSSPTGPATLPASAGEKSAIKSTLMPTKTTAPALSVTKKTAVTQPNQKLSQSSNSANEPIHPATAEETAAYQKSFDLLKTHQYKPAFNAFSDFVKQYKNSALAANAVYWKAEVAAVQGQNKEAAQIFSDVISLYPNSPKVPASLLRWADIETDLMHTKKAKALYQKIIKQYPNDNVAKKAKSRLDAMEGKGAQ